MNSRPGQEYCHRAVDIASRLTQRVQFTGERRIGHVDASGSGQFRKCLGRLFCRPQGSGRGGERRVQFFHAEPPSYAIASLCHVSRSARYRCEITDAAPGTPNRSCGVVLHARDTTAATEERPRRRQARGITLLWFANALPEHQLAVGHHCLRAC